MNRFCFSSVSLSDFEDLLALRILVMQEHLERLGRYSPDRARGRFAAGFAPEFMRKIMVDCDDGSVKMAGVVSLKPIDRGLELEHFYLHPDFQGAGLGRQVLAALIDEADRRNLPIHLGVLRESPAARFYERCGFQKTHEEKWDIYYRRAANHGKFDG